jgi:nucleoside-diphosphate-sugar epimerase
MKKKILLTGASGFTGRHFIELANELDYECVALCHKATDSVEGCTKIVVANLTNKALLLDTLSKVKPDYVVHLAAISFVEHGNIADIYQTNLIGTLNLLDSLIELDFPINKVLIASSGNVYGNNIQLPIREETLPKPVNDYGVSKYAMEVGISLRAEKLPIIVVRPFNYTGQGQENHFLIPKIVSAFKAKASVLELGNLDVARDFSDVRDVVNAYMKLLQSDTQMDTVNVCTGFATPLSSIIAILNKMAGYEIDIKVNPDFIRENEIKELYGDNSKLVKAIGEYRNHSLNDTLEWMYKN